ncbi:Protein of unknown function [Cotesia congregata]|uniref:Uncharacterized protein n=1 Tax=Cotesia congregata TaxID=51543 RepID=A0A8J2HFL8_COTCN|nr:Protein of unknown function [Cotesia congregata]
MTYISITPYCKSLSTYNLPPSPTRSYRKNFRPKNLPSDPLHRGRPLTAGSGKGLAPVAAEWGFVVSSSRCPILLPFQMKSRIQRTPVKKKTDTIKPANKSIRPLKFTNPVDPPKPPDPPDDPLPEPRARNSAFPNLVQKRNAIVETDSEQENIPAKNRTNALRFVFDVEDDTGDSSANTIINPSVPPPPNKKIVEVSAESSSQDPYWWDPNVQADQATTSNGQDNKNRKSSPVTFQHPLGNSTPLSHIGDSETEDDRPPQQARASLPQIPEEFSSDPSLPSEQVENFENPNSLAHNITNELFYPNIYREKPKLLEIHSTNENLTYYRDNYLHFISADCEFTTQISRLLIDTDYINPQDIKLKKPKVQQILVTPKGKHKVLSAVITNKHYDETTIPELKNILLVLKDVINHYELKTLRISKNGDIHSRNIHSHRVMMGAIQLAILVSSLLQPISGFIAFDCSTPFLNITTLSLLDVKDCNIPPPKPVITHSNVQLLQTLDFSMIKIIQCKLKVRRIIRYCGELSHLFGESIPSEKMKVLLGILPFFVLLPVVVTSDNNKIQTTPLQSGLLFEEVNKIRFNQGHWKVASSLFPIDLLLYRPNLPQLKASLVYNNCETHLLHDIRNQIIDRHNFEYLNSEIDLYIAKIFDELRALDISTKDSTPTFTVSDNMKFESYFRKIDNYNLPENSSHHTQNNKTLLLNENTQFINSIPYDTFEAIRERQSNCIKLSNLIINHPTSTSNSKTLSVFLDKIKTWSIHVRKLFDNYLDTLKEIMMGIQLARVGQLYPGIISPSKIITIAEGMVKTKQGRILPILLEKFTFKDLLKNRILIFITIPMLDSKLYNLYNLHPYPVSQTFGKNTKASAYIQPRTDYLLTCMNRYWYALLTENEIKQCTPVADFLLCPFIFPLYDSTIDPACEISLLNNQPHFNALTCDIRMSQAHQSYWKQLTTTPGWIYSLPETESIIITCNVANTVPELHTFIPLARTRNFDTPRVNNYGVLRYDFDLHQAILGILKTIEKPVEVFFRTYIFYSLLTMLFILNVSIGVILLLRKRKTQAMYNSLSMEEIQPPLPEPTTNTYLSFSKSDEIIYDTPSAVRKVWFQGPLASSASSI